MKKQRKSTKRIAKAEVVRQRVVDLREYDPVAKVTDALFKKRFAEREPVLALARQMERFTIALDALKQEADRIGREIQIHAETH
jgi:hypothetical protein